MAIAAYRATLRQPHVAYLLGTSLLARLPVGMMNLAILLLLTPRLGYGRAGVASGLATVGAGVAGVGLSRLVPTLGARAVLGSAAVGFAAAGVGLGRDVHGGYAGQLVLCLLLGLTLPPVSPVVRGIWPVVLGTGGTSGIFALEATAQELVFVGGPALVALVAAVAGRELATDAMVAACLLGTLALLRSPAMVTAESALRSVPEPDPAGTAEPVDDVGPPDRDSGGAVSPLWVYLLLAMTATFAFAMTELATVAFVGGRQANATAALVVALYAAGSMVGGLFLGASRHQPSDVALARWVTATAAGAAVCALAPNVAVLAVLLALAGVPIAPTLARLYVRIGPASRAGNPIVAFGLLSGAFTVGASVGTSVAGVVIDNLSDRAGYGFAGAAALLGVLILLASSRRDRPVASDR